MLQTLLDTASPNADGLRIIDPVHFIETLEREYASWNHKARPGLTRDGLCVLLKLSKNSCRGEHCSPASLHRRLFPGRLRQRSTFPEGSRPLPTVCHTRVPCRERS